LNQSNAKSGSERWAHLRTLELEGRREQIVVDREKLALKVNVTNNFETLEFGRRSCALHLFHDGGLEFGVTAKSSKLTFFRDSVLCRPLLGNVGIGNNDGYEHTLREH
jgi:hypothetical protein